MCLILSNPNFSTEQESRVGNRLETKKIAAAKFGEFLWILSH